MLEPEESVSNNFQCGEKQRYNIDWWNGFMTGFVLGGLVGSLFSILVIIGIKQS